LKSQFLIPYGIIGIPIAFLGLPIFIYLPTYFVQYLKINALSVALALFLARLFDMIIDPYIGKITNKSTDKYKFMIISSFLVIISLYFLINPIYYNFAWIFLFSLLTYLSYSFILIPYLSLNSSLATNETHSSKLSFSREVFIIIGTLFALLIPFVLDISSDLKLSLDALYYFLFLTLIPFILISKLKVSIKNKQINLKKNNFFSELKSYFQIRPENKSLMLAFLFNNTANALSATMFIMYVEHILGLKSDLGLFLIIYFTSAILGFYFWLKLSSKISKEDTWIVSILVSCLAFLFVIFLGLGDKSLYILICIVTGFCLSCDMAIPSSIQADITKDLEDIRDVLFGFWAMITKLALGLSVLISFGILYLSSYEQENINIESYYLIIFLYCILPIFLKVIAILYIKHYKTIK